MQQLPLSLDLLVVTYRDSARNALYRVTPKELAHYAHTDPNTLGNQFRLWTKRNKPSADQAFLLQHLDEQHAREVASLSGRIVQQSPVRDPADTLREIEARAAGRGFVAADEVRALLAQTRMPSAVEPATVDSRPVRHVGSVG